MDEVLKDWQTEKIRYLKMPLEEKRKCYYAARNYITINDLEPWCKYALRNKRVMAHAMDDYFMFQKVELNHYMNKDLSEKVSLFRGDITMLEIDAIINSTNSIFFPGGGIDKDINLYGGIQIMRECYTFGQCDEGDAKISGGYKLPAKYVIHAIGATDKSETTLQHCYQKCLSYVEKHQIRTIAFPCISTGICQFPKRLAAHIALRTVREFLENNPKVDRIIFCTFTTVDYDIYETLMNTYFPIDQKMIRLKAKIRIARRLFVRCQQQLEQALKDNNKTDVVALYEKLKGHRNQLEKLQTVMVSIMIDEDYDEVTVDQDVDAGDELEIQWYRLSQKVKESVASSNTK